MHTVNKRLDANCDNILYMYKQYQRGNSTLSLHTVLGKHMA